MLKRLVLGVAVVAVALRCGVASAEIKVKSVSGIVRVAMVGSEKYGQVLPGQILVEGMEIRTGENGRVDISLGVNNTVKLRGNARMVIRTHQANVSRFALLAGRIKGIFAGLTGGERFELEFGSTGAVASVKGTVFTGEVNENGASLHTIYGSMALVFNGRAYNVPQGCGAGMGKGARAKIFVLTNAQVQAGLVKASDRAKQRGNSHSCIRSAEKQARRTQQLVAQVREADFSAGRTLRDYHGNVVRVDQRIERPNSNTLQFINIAKRDSYRYRGRFTYNGKSGPRYDYLMGEVTFNMPLPDSVLDWPAFVVANSDYIEPLQARFELANGGPRDPNRDMISRTYVNEPDGVSSARSNGAVFTISTGNGVGGRIDRTVIVPDDDNLATLSSNGSATNDLWSTNVLLGYYDNGLADDAMTHANRVSIFVEGYALDANGSVLNLDAAAEGLIGDPLGYPLTVAGEGIISITDADGDVFGQGGLRPSNIDIVVIPDITIAILTRYGAALASMDDLDME